MLTNPTREGAPSIGPVPKKISRPTAPWKGAHLDAAGERVSTLQCAASRRELVPFRPINTCWRRLAMLYFEKSCMCCTGRCPTAASETKPSRRCAGGRGGRNLDYFERQHARMAW